MDVRGTGGPVFRYHFLVLAEPTTTPLAEVGEITVGDWYTQYSPLLAHPLAARLVALARSEVFGPALIEYPATWFSHRWPSCTPFGPGRADRFALVAVEQGAVAAGSSVRHPRVTTSTE